MGRRVAKKHRVKWTDRQELNEISYGAGQYWLEKWSKPLSSKTAKKGSSSSSSVERSRIHHRRI